MGVADRFITSTSGLVAVQEVALVGMAHFRAMPSPRGQNIGFLDDLVVAQRRGGGVGQLLRMTTMNWASERLGTFCWITRDNNYRARKLYDKLPVSQIGTS